jgi:site-specific DNA recombinase
MPHDSIPNDAAVYVRVSTTGQEAGTSLETQEEACRRFGAELGLDVRHVLHETYTGVEYFDRPAMSELRAMMRERRVAHVIFYVVDRVSRGGIYAALLHREARDLGILLYAAHDRWIAPMDDAGELMMYLHGWQAGGEWRQIQERATRTRRARPTYGALPTGQCPRYGFQWRDIERDGKVHRAGGYSEDERTSPAVRQIYEWYAGGVSTYQIEERLYARGIASPGGKPRWSRRAITRLIADPIYKGEAQALKTRLERLPGGRKRQIPIDGTPVPDAAPALVDSATWSAANARLRTNKSEAARNQPDPEQYLLRAGFIRCGECGSPMQAQTHPKRPHHRYRCPQWDLAIGSEALDQAVWDQVIARLAQPERVRAQLEAELARDPYLGDLARLDTQRGEARAAVENLTAAIAGATSSEAISALVARLEIQAERARELDEEYTALSRRRADLGAMRASLDQLERWCHTVTANAAALPYDEKRELLRMLGIWVEVFPAYGDEARTDKRWKLHANVDLGRWDAESCGTHCSQYVSQYRIPLRFDHPAA